MSIHPVDLIRHFYNVEEGRKVMEGTFGKLAHASADVVLLREKMQKAAAADPKLLKIALQVAGDRDVLEVYEQLGGTFKKEALGAPMFHPPAMSSSPKLPAPRLPAPSIKQPALRVPQQTQPKAPQPDQQQQPQGGQQVKVQLQSPGPGQQGTSVSVG